MANKIYTSSDTFVCPIGITSVIADGYGGGQGGQDLGAGTAGNGGNGAKYSASGAITTTPGSPYAITIGSGGAVNGTGGDTSFDAGADFLAPGGGSGTSAVGATYAGVLGGVGGAAGTGGTDNGGGGGGGVPFASTGMSNGHSGADGESSGNGGAGATAVLLIDGSTGGAGGDGAFAPSGPVATAAGIGAGGGGASSLGGDASAGGSGMLRVAWTPPTPSPGATNPGGGLLAGGTSFVIVGGDFSKRVTPYLGMDQKVTIGGVDCTSVVVVSDSLITAVSPAGASVGGKDIVVYNEDGTTGTLAGAWVYYSTGGGGQAGVGSPLVHS